MGGITDFAIPGSSSFIDQPSLGDLFMGTSTPARQTGTAQTMTPQQQATLNWAMSQMRGGVPGYTGQTTAGAAPLQTQTFDLISQILGGGGQVGAGQDALADLLKPFDPTSTNQYFQQSVQAPALRTWEQDILPKIRESFIGQNAGSSSAANRAIASSGSDLASNLSSTLGNLLFQSEQSALGRRQSAIDQILPMLTGQANLGLSAGGAQQGINQNQLTGAYQEFLRTQPSANPYLQLFGQAIGTPTFENIIQGPTQTQGILGPLLGAAGSVLGGAF